MYQLEDLGAELVADLGLKAVVEAVFATSVILDFQSYPGVFVGGAGEDAACAGLADETSKESWSP